MSASITGAATRMATSVLFFSLIMRTDVRRHIGRKKGAATPLACQARMGPRHPAPALLARGSRLVGVFFVTQRRTRTPADPDVAIGHAGFHLVREVLPLSSRSAFPLEAQLIGELGLDLDVPTRLHLDLRLLPEPQATRADGRADLD